MDMTPSALRRCVGPLLLAVLVTTAAVTTGCASTVTGTAGPVAPSARESAVSPVLPSAESVTPPSSTDAPTRDASTRDAPTSDAPTSASPPELPTIGTTRSTVTTPLTTRGVTTTATTTTATTTTAATTTAATTTAADPTAGGTTAAPAGLAIDHFTSPTGNITCMIFTDDAGPSARCDLTESSISEQHDCGGTGIWGRSVSLVRGAPASMTCISDTVMDAGLPTLAYGDSTTVDGLTCTSRQDGMTCRDDAGHRFRLSRNDYEVK